MKSHFKRIEEGNSIFLPIVKLNDLREGRGKLITINKYSIALFLYDGAIYAFDNYCPHQGGDLSDGYIKGGEINCPIHHWSFNLKTGAYSFNESIKIKTYITEIRNGVIYIDLAVQDKMSDDAEHI